MADKSLRVKLVIVSLLEHKFKSTNLTFSFF